MIDPYASPTYTSVHVPRSRGAEALRASPYSIREIARRTSIPEARVRGLLAGDAPTADERLELSASLGIVEAAWEEGLL